jgi:hypothetical protein
VTSRQESETMSTTENGHSADCELAVGSQTAAMTGMVCDLVEAEGPNNAVREVRIHPPPAESRANFWYLSDGSLLWCGTGSSNPSPSSGEC